MDRFLRKEKADSSPGRDEVTSKLAINEIPKSGLNYKSQEKLDVTHVNPSLQYENTEWFATMHYQKRYST